MRRIRSRCFGSVVDASVGCGAGLSAGGGCWCVGAVVGASVLSLVPRWVAGLVSLQAAVVGVSVL